MSTTITADTTTNGITLGQDGFISPLTVAAGVVVTSIGDNGFYSNNSTYILENAGSISASGGFGVEFQFGGTVTNETSGLVSGNVGILSYGTVQNAGSVSGQSNGVELNGDFRSVYLDNQAGGSITGLTSAGVVGLFGEVTVLNAGTITGVTDAVTFNQVEAARLIIVPGASFSGNVVGPETNGIIELQAGTDSVTGTLTGLGSSFTNFGSIQVDSTATWVLNGSSPQNNDYTFSVLGELTNYDTLTGDTVSVGASGALDNQSLGGDITGAATAIIGVGKAASVQNDGIVDGSTTGIDLEMGGSVYNQGTLAQINGGTYGVELDLLGSVTNEGTIDDANLSMGDGILLEAGGSVDNTGDISGAVGIDVSAAAGTVENFGVITGIWTYGVDLAAGGTFTNDGTVIGGEFFGPDVVGTAVVFGTPVSDDSTTASNLLVIDPSAVFTGIVVGSATGSNRMELAAGSSTVPVTGTITGLGYSFINFSTIDVDSAAFWDVDGTNTLSSDVVVNNSGTVHLDGTIDNAGTIKGTASETSGFTIEDGGTLDNTGTITSADTTGVEGAVVVFGSLTNSGSIFGGVELLKDGNFQNQVGGTVSGGANGVLGTEPDIGLLGQTESVDNSGVIDGSITGIDLESGGTIDNHSLSTIYGGKNGIDATGGAFDESFLPDPLVAETLIIIPSIILNDGTIGGGSGIGISLDSGGSVSNSAFGLIDGLRAGVEVAFGVNSVFNAGTIEATGSTSGVGIDLFLDTAHLTNAAGGLIRGYVGVSSVGGTITNAGTITGTGGTAVTFAEFDDGLIQVPSSNLLVIDPGAVFIGTAVGSMTVSNTLELAPGFITQTTFIPFGSITETFPVTGTINGLGTSFTNFNVINVDSTAIWEVDGSNTLTSVDVLDNFGQLTLAGTLDTAGTINGNGSIDGGVTVSGSLNNTGTIDGLNTNLANGAVAVSGLLTNSGSILNGVDVQNGGTFTNAMAGTVSGGSFGVFADHDGTSTVENDGTILGSDYGVSIDAGSVANLGSLALIDGDTGVRLRGSGTVRNEGTIEDAHGGGVVLEDGGVVQNTGFISGFVGVDVSGNPGTVTNLGTITGNLGFGVYLQSGGTFTNAGTVSGGSPSAALVFGDFDSDGPGTGSNLLVIDPSAVFNGLVAGSDSGSNAMELASGISASSSSSASPGTSSSQNPAVGTIAGLGTSFVNFDTITVDSTATWDFDGVNTLIGTGTLLVLGTLVNEGILIGAPVTLGASGVLNDQSIETLITGAATGVVGVGPSASIDNFGVIDGATTGINLEFGGTISADEGSVIDGGQDGVDVAGGVFGVLPLPLSIDPGTIFNDGSITGGTGVGVKLESGGYVLNKADGVISGYGVGVEVAVGADTVINGGSITATATNGFGVYLFLDVAHLTNAAGGVISGNVGVAAATGTVINAGTITGTGGTAVSFTEFGDQFALSPSSNLVVIDPSAVFNGIVAGSTIGSTTIELAGSFVSVGHGEDLDFGTIAGLGTSFTNFNAINVDTDGRWVVEGVNTLASSVVVDISGGLDVAGTLDNAGTMFSQGFFEPGFKDLGLFISGTLNNTGTLGSVQTVGSVSGEGYRYAAVVSGLLTNSGAIIDGIGLDPGGIFQNEAAGTVSGGKYGVEALGSALEVNTVVNDGTILGRDTGVYINAGSVANLGSLALIEGETGVYLYGFGTVTNEGTITTPSDAVVNPLPSPPTGVVLSNATEVIKTVGVELYDGGVVDNTGVISGDVGIAVDAFGTVNNYGTITGTSSFGVNLAAGGTFVNGGTVSGGDGTAVSFSALDPGSLTDGNLLVLDPGAVFTGIAAGAVGGSNTMELAPGSSEVPVTGTVSGLGISFTNFNLINVDSAATWEVDGTNTLTSHVVVENSGQLMLAGTLDNAGTINGTATGVSGLAISGTLNNTGTLMSADTGQDEGAAVVSGLLTNSGTILDGIELTLGGTFTNNLSGTVTAGTYGVFGADDDTGTVVNDGIIMGNSTGVELGTGSVANLGSLALIEGSVGVAFTGLGTVTNEGTILDSFGGAVLLNDGGTVSNTGDISGSVGVGVIGAPASIDNIGVITGTASYGVYLGDGGTFTNAGTVSGGGGTAVLFGGSLANVLAIYPSAVFTGIVEGGTAALANQILLQSATSAGTLTGLGSNYVSFGGVTVAAGADWTLTGTNVLATGYIDDFGTLTNAGTLTADVYLYAGSSFSNPSASVLSGSDNAVVSYGTGQSFTNGGDITAPSHGVEFLHGGTFTNAAGATVTTTGTSGSNNGVEVRDGLGSVYNAGVINATYTGIDLLTGGSVTNALSASVTGDSAGIAIDGSAAGALVLNAGTVESTATFAKSVGIAVASGTVSNAVSGYVSGYNGVYLLGANNTLINQGTITATGSSQGFGVEIVSGSITNEAGGAITADTGLYISGAATLVNAGTINGTDGTAVAASGSSEMSSSVVIDPGAEFIGSVVMSPTVTNTLELAASTNSAIPVGEIFGIGDQYVNFNTVLVDSGAQWAVGGRNSLGALSTVINSGTLIVQGATLDDAGGFENDGVVVLQAHPSVTGVVLPAAGAGLTDFDFKEGSSLSLAKLTGVGGVTIGSGATLEVSGAVSPGQTISFDSVPGGLFQTSDSVLGDMAGTIAGFASGDLIDVTGLAYVAGSTTASVAGNVLTVTDSTAIFTFATTGLVNGTDVYTIADGRGGTEVTFTPPAPVVLGLADGSDSGTVGDLLTNDTLPSITGTTVPNGTVDVYEDGNLVGQGSSDGTGAFTATLTVALTEGPNDLTATVTDSDGNLSAASGALEVTLDTSIPDAPTALALLPASDSGLVGDDITDVALPTVTGMAPALSTVSIYDGGVFAGTGTADETGAWSILSTVPLTAGLNDITAVAVNTAGTPSASSAPLQVTYEPSSDTPTLLALAAASDSGVVGDGITDDSLPVITGTADPLSAVTVFDGLAPVGTGTADGSGAWSVTLTTALTEGANTLTASAVDLAGDTSPASAALQVTLDTAIPAAPSGLSLAAASDSGTLGDDLTSKALPTVDGTAPANDVVDLYDGGVPVGTGVADATGAFAITLTTALNSGINDLTGIAVSVSGEMSGASTVLPVTLDTSVPAAPTGLALAVGSDSGRVGDDITNVALPTVTGEAPPLTDVALYLGTVLVGQGQADGTGLWSITSTVPLTAGLNSLQAVATNAAGTSSVPSGALPVTYEAGIAAPLGLALGSDSGVVADGITDVALPVITGTAEPGSTVTLYDGTAVSGTAVADSSGAWSIASTVALTEGVNDITATATDVAGTVSAASAVLAVTLYTVAPPPAGLALAAASDSGTVGDNITNVAQPTLVGTGVAGDTIALFDGTTAIGSGPVAPDGTWSIVPASPLADGAHSITAVQTGLGGAPSAATAALSLTIDTAAPAAPADLALASGSDSAAQGDGITNITLPTLTGTAEAGDTVAITAGTGADATVLGTAVADIGGTWSFTPSTGLADDAYVFAATATDAAGNVSAPSQGFDVTIDTVAPVVTATAEANPAQASTPGISYSEGVGGTGDPSALVTIFEAGAAVGTAQADDTGAWFFDASALKPGAHVLTASETDVAGNTGAAAAVSISVVDPRFAVSDTTKITSGTLFGNNYTGPVSYLTAEYTYNGTDNVVLAAQVADVYLRSGSGEDALQALAGNNVLDGSTGSNWLVGATGADGGHDTFFVDGGGGQQTWDTLLNFHVGDMLTLWGFNAATGTTSWSDSQGAAGYLGATLHANFGGASGGTALVTFDGLTTSNAHFDISGGSSGGQTYLAITRTS